MGKFKTVKTEGKVVSVEGKLRVLSDTTGFQRKVELWLLNDKETNNTWTYANLEEHRRLFAETPILVAYVGNKIGDGHNFDEIRNADGSITESFMSATAERIVGFFRSESDIRLEKVDGKNWIVGTGYIWEWYAQELVAKLKQQGLEGMAVSIETLIEEMHTENGKEVFTKYLILGTTILGDDVKPAVTGANIKLLSAMGAEEVKKLTLRVASQNERAENNKNQSAKTKNSKGEKHTTMRTKKFDGLLSGCTVLAADSANIALLSESGVPHLCGYTEDDMGGITLGARVEVAANALFVNGEVEVSVPVETIIGKLNSRIERLLSEKEAADTAKEAAEAKIAKMEKAENSRRQQAVRDKVKARLAQIKADNAIALEDSVCDCLLADEKVAEYALMEDCNGEFIGDIAACKDLDALCMDKIIASNRQKANNAKSRMAWEIDDARSETTQKGMLSAVNNIVTMADR